MSGPSPEVSILLVTFNGKEAVRGCLASIMRVTLADECEVLAIDNASNDGTADMISSEFPSVRLTRSRENLGFGRAVNRLANDARGRWLILLNPDTELHEGTVARLVEYAVRNPGAGLIGGRTLRSDGTVDPSSCWGLPTVWSLTCFALGLTTAFPRNRFLDPESLGRWERDTVREVGLVTGCLLLADRSVWHGLGGFDPRFWLYGEDADLSARARQAGYHPTIVPGATIFHDVGGSSDSHGAKMVLVMRGKATYLLKHWTGSRRRYGLLALQAGAGLRALLGYARRPPKPSGWEEVWARRAEWRSGYPSSE